MGTQKQKEHLKELRTRKSTCNFCKKQISYLCLKRHIRTCYMNPSNLKKCKICGKPVKHKTRDTCSYSCSNTLFRSGENNPNYNDEKYRNICFKYHKKECVICGEQNIVAVHHFDKNHQNNSPENLIPLCPTHHQYCHSSFYEQVKDKICEYIKKFRELV